MRSAALMWDLHKASLRARTGTVALLAIAAMTVASTLFYLVAGGTWMFYQRAHNLDAADAVVQGFAEGSPGIAHTWTFLALIACAFLLPAIFSLVAQSAVMGASGRERRLATLRLLGLSSVQITKVTVWETGLQALIGVVCGGMLSVLVAPVFGSLTFMNQRVAFAELLLPWWGYLGVTAIIVALSLGAAFIGMQRVRVSPLGVARREMPRAVRMWRLILLAVCIPFGVLILPRAELGASAGIFLGVAGFLLLVVFVTGVAAPFIIQVAFQIAGNFPGVAHFVASRRISTSAKAAWKRSSGLAYLGIIAGFLLAAPIGADGFADAAGADARDAMLFHDLGVGAILTLVFGYILAAISIALAQASEVFESASLAQALQLMGVRRGFQSCVAWLTVLAPLILVSIIGFFVGVCLSLMMFAQVLGYLDLSSRILSSAGLLAAGWAMSAVALAAVEPLRGSVLRRLARRAD